MTVVVWLVEETWQACVRAVPEGADVLLLHVSDHDVAGAAHGAFAGLFGRAHPERDPGFQVDELTASNARRLLDAAEASLGRPCRKEERVGRVGHEVVAAAQDASLLIVARDTAVPGPKSIGHHTRFVVDHATCPLLLVTPDAG